VFTLFETLHDTFVKRFERVRSISLEFPIACLTTKCVQPGERKIERIVQFPFDIRMKPILIGKKILPKSQSARFSFFNHPHEGDIRYLLFDVTAANI